MQEPGIQPQFRRSPCCRQNKKDGKASAVNFISRSHRPYVENRQYRKIKYHLREYGKQEEKYSHQPRLHRCLLYTSRCV